MSAATSTTSTNGAAAQENDATCIEHVPVLIVGAGPTGLLLAGQLARRGVVPRLIDRNPAPLEWDRATVINTATLEVMDALGIADQFCDEGVHIRGTKMHSSGEVIGTYRFEENDSRFGHGLGLSEERTEHFLAEYLVGHGGEIQWSSKMVHLETLEGNKGVVATIEKSSVDEDTGEVVSTSTYQIRADYVVGCDGIRSKTRHMAGIKYEGHVIEPSSTSLWPVGRRPAKPFAQMILQSGEASEKATMMKCPNQRAARDKMLRSVFASVLGTRKKATVMSKTELNVEYGASSIVSGNASFGHPAAPGPGGSMPNTHTVKLGPDDGWKAAALHELTFRAGHTVLLLGGPGANGSEFVELYKEAGDLVASSHQAGVFDAVFAFTTDPSLTSLNGKIGLLESSTVDAFGVKDVVMLVIRPDGFIGLRASDKDSMNEYPKMLAKYSKDLLG